MKFNKIVSVQMSSRRSMLRPTDFLARIVLHDEVLSEMRPTKWGWWEPRTHAWDMSDLYAFIPPDRDGNADYISWSRSGKFKSFGSFGVNASSQRFHATEYIHCELSNMPLEKLKYYAKKSSIDFDCDICLIHFIAAKEKLLRSIESDFDGVPLSGYRDGSEMALIFNERTLRYWLPSLPWATIFGDAYVRMFGMERLLSAPAFYVEKLSDSAVYIQLTPNLSDPEIHYDDFHAARLRVQTHLGNEAFFDIKRAYPLRGPMGTIPADQFLKALAEFSCPPPGTNGFKVPEFHFIED